MIQRHRPVGPVILCEAAVRGVNTPPWPPPEHGSANKIQAKQQKTTKNGGNNGVARKLCAWHAIRSRFFTIPRHPKHVTTVHATAVVPKKHTWVAARMHMHAINNMIPPSKPPSSSQPHSLRHPQAHVTMMGGRHKIKSGQNVPSYHSRPPPSAPYRRAIHTLPPRLPPAPLPLRPSPAKPPASPSRCTTTRKITSPVNEVAY